MDGQQAEHINMKEVLGGMDQNTLVKFNAGKDIAEKIEEAWRLIFKYENFFSTPEWSTNMRSEVNDRLDRVKLWANQKWPTYINTGSAGASAMAFYPGIGLLGIANSMSGMVGTGPSGGLGNAKYPHTGTMPTPGQITSYMDIFNEPPWYKRWYKVCKDAPFIVLVYLRRAYKWGLL